MLLRTGLFLQSITDIQNLLEYPPTLYQVQYHLLVISSIVLAVCVALVIIGGLRRISTVSEIVVPFMAGLYVFAALTILITNITKIPDAVVTIIESAFGLRAAAGGALGAVMVAMQKGIARGIFSNESGLGSTPSPLLLHRLKNQYVRG